MNDISTTSSSNLPTVILVVLALVGVVLGGAGLHSSLKGRDAVDAVKARMESDLGGAQQLQSDVRMLAGRSENAFNSLNRDVLALREQLSNTLARAAAPQAKASAKKGDKVEQPLDPNGTYHKIKPGDFLSRVAKQYGTTVEAVEALNPGLDSRRMKLGQKIRVK